MAMVDFFSTRVGTLTRLVFERSRGAPSPLITPHMVAAARAILERIPLVDFTIEAPLSSACLTAKQALTRNRRIILLNKADLADRCLIKKWIKHFEEDGCFCHVVNSHNKDDIKRLLNFVKSRTKDLGVNESYSTTFMLVGIPNVGKSAIVNALHLIGRINAAEKGKLRHAGITSQPGETKDIMSFKIASHPNIYVLDTPGVLFPENVEDLQRAAKLALIGTIQDALVGELDLARYLLAIFFSNDEYKHWQSLNSLDSVTNPGEKLARPEPVRKKRRQYPTDHTQDFIVKDVRRTLFKTLSLIDGRNLQTETEMCELIESLLVALHEAFRVPLELNDGSAVVVAAKLLNLFRTGRLGRHALDTVPE